MNLQDKVTVNKDIKKLYDEKQFSSLNQIFGLISGEDIVLSKQNQLIFLSTLVKKTAQ